MILPSAASTFTFALLITCVGLSDAFACRGPQFEWTIFFDDVPVESDAPVMAEVTIKEVLGTVDRFYLVGRAQVGKVLKGEVGTQEIKLLSAVSSCGGGFETGNRGIVIGTLRRNDQNELELLAAHQTYGQRENRKALKEQFHDRRSP